MSSEASITGGGWDAPTNLVSDADSVSTPSWGSNPVYDSRGNFLRFGTNNTSSGSTNRSKSAMGRIESPPSQTLLCSGRRSTAGQQNQQQPQEQQPPSTSEANGAQNSNPDPEHSKSSQIQNTPLSDGLRIAGSAPPKPTIQNGDPIRTIKVSGIPPNTNKDVVQRVFSNAGEIHGMKGIRDGDGNFTG